ncbi:MAG: nickel pincer cofactor biosynthesis protein LarC [Phycisphaerae bacterium]|nr:nickel pincer cofactor biosynthesis protein LarC [Phycisphaerae bacterium]
MIGYLDLPSGLSGDMFLGCLVDAGWSVDRLRAIVESLGLTIDECAIDAETVLQGPLRATRVKVRAAASQHHRHLADIERILDDCDLPNEVRNRALAVFTRLAKAEARVHGVSVDEIHFHEVGAVDAIVDIIGAVAGLADLKIKMLYASAVPLGSGWTKCSHGQIPLPAPATLELLAAVNAPTIPALGPGEWVTPTGAALLAELASFQQPAMSLQKIAYGAGGRSADWPNVARLWVGEQNDISGKLVQLETNIDDMNPQLFQPVSEKLFAAGANDVWFTPIQMKKNRPAILLSALVPADREMQLTEVIFRETTTLGVRVHNIQRRHELDREIHKVETAFGDIRVKVRLMGGEIVGATPEYEDCRTAAAEANVPVRTVLDAATAAAQQIIEATTHAKDR